MLTRSPILPPIVEESVQTESDVTTTEPQVTPPIISETGPSQTQASVQGPTMYEQLQMAHTKHAYLAKNDIAAKTYHQDTPPMTGTGFMPCFSSRPAIPGPKTIIKEHEERSLDLSKWPSQSSSSDQQK
ncbi:hypothetical protein Salat_2075700 [Sesamum alatum]|uniref:Uncharacterized protein n=1 Tax=Sesamum alatum TaxID=300844 RepID=A0AAE1Y0H2_9LAMI|nr:hypothetical protein Salat_2075700 [Sesamum alatum]